MHQPSFHVWLWAHKRPIDGFLGFASCFATILSFACHAPGPQPFEILRDFESDTCIDASMHHWMFARSGLALEVNTPCWKPFALLRKSEGSMYQSVQAASSWGLRLQCGEGLDIRWEMTIKTLQPRHLLASLLGLGLVSKSWLNKLTESRYTVSNIFMRVSGFKWKCSFRLVWDGWDGSELTKCKWKAIPIRQSLWFCSAWHRF